MKVIELFGGIGAPHKALEKLGYNVELVDMVEFEPKKVAAYNAIHGTNFQAQDVTTWDKDVTCDYLHASTPCQAFSLTGKQLGAADPRGAPLWDATLRIIRKTQPKIVTLENVKGLTLDKHKELFNTYIAQMALMGYRTEWKVLDSKYFGVPQTRERVFLLSVKPGYEIKWPEMKEENMCGSFWETCMDHNAPLKSVPLSSCKMYFNMNKMFKNPLSQYVGRPVEILPAFWEKPVPKALNRVGIIRKGIFDEEPFVMSERGNVFNTTCRFHSPHGYIPTLCARNCKFYGKILMLDESKENLLMRELTALECLRLMGFDDIDYLKCQAKGISDATIEHAAGNSIVVNVMEAIFKALELDKQLGE